MLEDDLETYLATFAPWTQSGTAYTVRKFETPDTPDAVIVLIALPAGKPIRAMGSSIGAPVREKAGLMVKVRGPQKDYANARAIAESVYTKLDFYNGTLSGRRYEIQAMHSPALYKEDRNDRWWIETNYLVQKERG